MVEGVVGAAPSGIVILDPGLGSAVMIAMRRMLSTVLP
jgi:hypothetical protein